MRLEIESPIPMPPGLVVMNGWKSWGAISSAIPGPVSDTSTCMRSGATTPQFVYHDHGSLISLGSFAAVGVLNRASSVQGIFVGGLLARVLYGLMYQKHVVALQGVGHMMAQTVAIWLRKKLSPAVKLH